MINKIIIENFKSIKKEEIKLSKINFLIGANGAGKSNFISFFEFLNKLYLNNLQSYVQESGGAENILYYGSKESNFIHSIIEFDNSHFYEFSLKPTQSDNLFFEYETLGVNKNKLTDEPLWQKEIVFNQGGNESKILSSETKKHKNFKEQLTSYKVYHFHDTSKTALIKKSCKIDDNSFLREDASNLAAFLYFLKEKHKKEFSLIEKVVKSVAPFFQEFDLKPQTLNQEYIKLVWKEENSDKYFDAFSLSDGTLRFICLATLLLQPKLPKTVIIDEPELGLHPFAIEKLAGLIRLAGQKSQLIISTQSINLIENFDVDNIIVVNRNNKESIFGKLNFDELRTWLDDYSLGELWDMNLIGGRP